jgi:DNA-binding MarR family transcriptional regulator
MTEELNAEQVAGALMVGIRLLVRRVRQFQAAGELTLPESSALTRLDRGGPTTSSVLAKQEQISPQSMGATLASLESRGLVDRSADPEDGRRVVLAVTDAGRAMLQSRRNERTQHLAAALETGFSAAELTQLMAAAPLIERLAQRI